MVTEARPLSRTSRSIGVGFVLLRGRRTALEAPSIRTVP